ncbi:TPA: hypothetical protein ACHW7I_001795 [Legionella pneumophila]|uniref:Uncharacterized protein n=1 Tax=Legionella pneumophila subsp. pneumophila TaxID=91891 RepID=A0AAV2UZJ0_LEGPN|nr:hypothetical protein [Legionella pneumophila]MCK1849259.1 hypothetical protein [Legionella pneumophila]MCZ4805353.1 hypothetical protein [Legionella pneumophila]MDI9852533.1 hypothetical protein [Legionella pneumophila]MDW8854040.1 hypothetical protein [Legionella pneumophila]MDW8866762.1 hypothetical protein [Legionella pneumophila]
MSICWDLIINHNTPPQTNCTGHRVQMNDSESTPKGILFVSNKLFIDLLTYITEYQSITRKELMNLSNNEIKPRRKSNKRLLMW